MTHNIKVRVEFSDAILKGEKNFEIRENDRGYQKGDIINFTVIDKNGVTVTDHDLNYEYFVITYVLSGWGIKENYVALGIKKLENDDDTKPDKITDYTEDVPTPAPETLKAPPPLIGDEYLNVIPVELPEGENPRQVLVRFCKEHDINILDVSKTYKLNNETPDSEFIRVLGILVQLNS